MSSCINISEPDPDPEFSECQDGQFRFCLRENFSLKRVSGTVSEITSSTDAWMCINKCNGDSKCLVAAYESDVRLRC